MRSAGSTFASYALDDHKTGPSVLGAFHQIASFVISITGILQWRQFDLRQEAVTMPQPLPPKEASHFRAVIRSYEDKQYKRGLKTADLILKKIPRHGDTMAMKALILNAQGKTEEAFALGKEALTVDMKSHICWHVYGLLYRANKNFEEAIKAYKFALKLEPESAQIQRDLAILQVQMRDYPGYIQSRTAMLQARPQLRQSWTALAIAQHLAGNLAEAENVLTTYEGTLKTTPSRTDIEHSEAILYKNSIIAEQGDYQRALDHLEASAKHSLDRLAFLESRAEYLQKLGRNDEAAKAYRALIDRNSERPTYYTKLIEALNIPKDDVKARKAVFDEYAQKLPRCDAARRLPLDFLDGDEFKEAAKSYLGLMLDKGVPSTFANLKHLYSNAFKKSTLADLAAQYLTSQDTNTTSKDKGEAAALYYLAQHYNYHLSRDLDKAMDYVEQAIKKDPKSVDFHMTKARILKHSGDLQQASEVMDRARSLDLKDRYINSKAAKYQLRNNENDKALKTVGLFTRAETVGGPLADLLDMQCVWYLTEDGEAYARQGNTGLALKRFHAIGNIFDVWQEDQFDFHSFSLRKGQIRAYIDTIRWEDHLRDHPFYSRAALDAIDLYLKMADKPAANGVNGADGEDSEDALARKKAAKKAKKEQQRLEREAAEKQAKQDPNKSSQGGETKKKDEDPLGLKLAATTEPLSEAMKFLGPLLQASPKSVEAQIAGFEVYMRRKKYVLALRCLNAGLALDSERPELHVQAVTFRNLLNGNPELPPKVAEVLKGEFKAIEASQDLKQYNAEYRAKHKSNPRHVLAAIKAQKVLGEDKNACEKQLLDLTTSEGLEFTDALEILDTLKRWRSSEVEAFKKLAQSKWPAVTRLA
ncbi:N-alpha-acetyltransferase 16, NatA auxiliary subunit [Paramyrothecium foliicola]|nr:N-alpha-acetyltransferase 16, NatA auxiliary subunit [Paramyrothecium foliicola]